MGRYNRWQLYLCFSVLIAVFTGLSIPVRAADPYDALERALGLLDSGEVDSARMVLTSAQGENLPEGLRLDAQATVDLTAGNAAAAETTCRKALAENPQDLAALWTLSLCLLQRGHAFEATTYLDRAATAAPDDRRIKTLQAYVYLLLGRLSDAATIGKTALEAGENSPFLMATLAQIHRRLGYTQKALEFGSFAAKSYYGMDFLADNRHVMLPLTMIITDSPQALTTTPTEAPTGANAVQRTDIEIELPKATPTAPLPEFEILSPKAGATLRGQQYIHAIYRGTREIKFVIFQVDHVLRGMTTDIPYQFTWDADAVIDGEHTLTVRAYDYRGILAVEQNITISTNIGKTPVLPVDVTGRSGELTRRMLGITMPAPAPLSLFTQMGWWYKDAADTPKAIAAFEKAAAIDPTAEGVLGALAELYTANGMHAISPTGELFHAVATDKKRVALTFDDGPNPLYTPTILAELKRVHAQSTFFMVGKMVQQYPDLALQILAEGHELANHTYTHPNMTKLKQQEIIAEVLRTRAAIKEITGHQTYFFRPPGGNIDPFVTKQLRALDYNIIYWSINAGEFRKMTPEKQTAAILGKIKDGSILLLHNGPVDGTLNILPQLLDELTKRGFTCVTITELMKDAAPTKDSPKVE